MPISVCPSAVVAAPVECVWELLAEPARYDEWWDVHTGRVEPPGPAAPGQVFTGTTRALGRTWQVVAIRVEMVNPDRHQIRLHARLPLGIVDDATITVRALDPTSSLLQFG